MLKIDDQNFTPMEIESRLNEISFWLTGQPFPVTRLAVCAASPVDWLVLVFYCRQHNISLAPLYPDTPYAAALAKARAMQCDALWWQQREGLQAIECGGHSAASTGVLIQMSSGTTGTPKIVERSWQSISDEIQSYNQTIHLPLQVTPVIACSVTHSYGLICGVLATLARGCVPHVITTWNPKYVLRVLASYDKPILYSAPAFIYSLVQLLPKAESPQTNLYAVMTSGMVLPDIWFNVIQQRVTHFYQQYGCSEVGCISIAKNPQMASVIGRALPHLKLYLAGNSSEAAAGAAEIPPDLVGSPPDMADTAGELVVEISGKRVYTQDLVRPDLSGDWIFCSRLDDTIIVAGLNVYPVEVENALLQLPGVTEVVVYKSLDDLTGQRVAALYASEREIPLTELRAWCAQRLARHQWPSQWQRVAEIPKLANGKISRRLLADCDFAARPNMEVA